MRRELGFSYVIVMFLVAMVSLLSLRALRNSLTTERREKEAQLLLIGQAYRQAIADYYQHSPGSNKTFPPTLDALLLDQRATRPARPLRKLYRDPITGSTEWGVVHNEAGAVLGVYSLSTQVPYKKNGFPPELLSFVNATSYQAWRFVYQPAVP